MTKFLVSARKYRPQSFAELVAQEHVAETLRNAIRLDRLAHAYLFCGPRGVGKTSAARILAKAVNCMTPLDERTDAEPCRTCDSCSAFEQGRSLNVIEIDAASNNSVDDVRALRETVRVPPQVGSKKVYIIDEVHMLSKQAFNALLKTLEEPPPHVQFLFATTEPHRVIPTILSRCQRFDFRRISVSDIMGRLREICQDEGIEADEASLRLIARKGDGALRDAFSTFDQAVLLCGSTLEYAALSEALGSVDVDVFFETMDLVSAHDRAGSLRLVERLVSGGYDINEYLVGLTDHVRNLLIALTIGSTELLETDPDTASRFAEQAGRFTEQDLLRHLIIANEAQEALRTSVKPRLRLELTLLKMASLVPSADLNSILRLLEDGGPPGEAQTGREKPRQSVQKREKNRSASQAVPAGSATASGPSSHPPNHPAGLDEGPAKPLEKPTPAGEGVEVGPANRASMQPEAVDAAATRLDSADEAAPAPEQGPGTEPAPASKGSPAVAPIPEEASEVAVQPPPSAQPETDPTLQLFGPPALSKPGRQSEGDKANPSDEPEREPGSANSSAEEDPAMSRIRTAWDSYIAAVMKDRIHVGALLQHASPHSVVGDTVEIAVPDDFHERLLDSESAYLADKLATTLSLDPRPSVRVVILSTEAQQVTVPELDTAARIEKLKEENPIFKDLIDKFGGEIVW